MEIVCHSCISMTADGGDLASVAIMANGHYYFDFSDSWSPYIGLGVGFLQEIDSDVELVGIADQKDLEDQILRLASGISMHLLRQLFCGHLPRLRALFLCR